MASPKGDCTDSALHNPIYMLYASQVSEQTMPVIEECLPWVQARDRIFAVRERRGNTDKQLTACWVVLLVLTF